MAEKLILSIAMLASRNKAEVKRCLDSLRPIMDKIPSELIIVDTSKEPSVHELCLEYTDKVAEFDWCDDFSKARNVSVKMAEGEWYLFIDDDEWFVEYQELIDFFRSGKYKGYGCANYIQRNFHDQAGTFCSDNWVSRMIRLYPETRFYSKIHEYIAPQIGQCINLRAVVNHTGYIALTREAKLKKFERNYPLLLQMLKEEPERLRWRVQIVQEFNNVQKWEEMLHFCEESVRVTTGCTDPQDYRDIGTFYAGILTSLVALGRYDAALGVERAMKLDKRLSRLCHAYCALQMARLHFCRRECEAAEEQLRIYEEGRKYFSAHPKELAEQEGALLVGTAYDDMCMKRALSLRIGCALLRGDISLLREHYDELGWGRQVMYMSDDLFPVLVEAMATQPEDAALLTAMQDLWNNKEVAAKLFAAIEGKNGQEPAYRNLLGMTAKMQGEFWYIWYAKLLAADINGDGSHLAEDFEEFCRHTPDVFLTPENVLAVLHKYGVSVEEGYLSVPFERWKEQLADYIGKVPLSDILATEQELKKIRSRESVHIDYALARLAEARVLHSVGEKDYNARRRSFADFAKRTSAFGRRYFKEEIIENYPELLPAYVQAGILLERAFACEETDMPQAAELMRRAASVNEGIGEAVKQLLQAIADERRRRELEEKEELRKLEQGIKAQVRACMEKAQYPAALEILAQLRAMRPNDLEVAELTLAARLGSLKK
ncbi:MAG: glycosyltransferase [Muribaculaceae bacterium]|nr:glycosyltransferase [Roseburia sp.]MCM1429828.1 glycosyltransferase [Muribaculaceae bacterium]MCM1492879.1 glycosyltransferase [Muribaculaceae bacterium]